MITDVSTPGIEDQAFNIWYDTKFKPGMERSPLDKYVARQAWYAALSQPQSVAQGDAVAVVKVEDDNGFERIVHMEHSLKPGTHHLYKAPTIPTGHRVVPVEPTEAMVASGHLHGKDPRSMYQAMLSASPINGGA